ncbi:MAG: leucyl aminopeptidase family protein [Phycisphaerales bacterium]
MFESIRVVRKGVSPAVVFGHYQDEEPDAQTRSRAKALGFADALKAARARPEATGEAGSVGESFSGETRVIALGLGKRDSCRSSCLRLVAANLGRKLAASKTTAVTLELSGALQVARLDEHECGSCFGEGIGLLAWVCDEFRGTATKSPKRTKLDLRSESAEFLNGVERGLALAESTNIARTLSQTPPNIATPAFMARAAQKLARELGLKCTVMEGDALERERMAGHLNVGKASENKPCIVRLEYTPKGGGKGKPAVLIGKTMCYDTGGLSLKVNNGMVGMKRDKDGGCAVLGAMHAIATVIKPRRKVVAFLAAAENSISDEAYRPDDVITYRNGVTVEVTNTDAEGRLVLADVLCWACEKEGPAFIVDIATLTGGVVIALGSSFAGMFCEDDKLRAKVEAASAASGERVWRLPMHAEYRDMMKSPVADIVNSNPNRKAAPAQGAAFLSYFVDDKIPWCHLDIAGVHATEKNAGAFIEGPTGWGVRLMANLVDE